MVIAQEEEIISPDSDKKEVKFNNFDNQVNTLNLQELSNSKAINQQGNFEFSSAIDFNVVEHPVEGIYDEESYKKNVRQKSNHNNEKQPINNFSKTDKSFFNKYQDSMKNGFETNNNVHKKPLKRVKISNEFTKMAFSVTENFYDELKCDEIDERVVNQLQKEFQHQKTTMDFFEQFRLNQQEPIFKIVKMKIGNLVHELKKLTKFEKIAKDFLDQKVMNIHIDTLEKTEYKDQSDDLLYMRKLLDQLTDSEKIIKKNSNIRQMQNENIEGKKNNHLKISKKVYLNPGYKNDKANKKIAYNENINRDETKKTDAISNIEDFSVKKSSHIGRYSYDNREKNLDNSEFNIHKKSSSYDQNIKGHLRNNINQSNFNTVSKNFTDTSIHFNLNKHNTIRNPNQNKGRSDGFNSFNVQNSKNNHIFSNSNFINAEKNYFFNGNNINNYNSININIDDQDKMMEYKDVLKMFDNINKISDKNNAMNSKKTQNSVNFNDKPLAKNQANLDNDKDEQKSNPDLSIKKIPKYERQKTEGKKPKNDNVFKSKIEQYLELRNNSFDLGKSTEFKFSEQYNTVKGNNNATDFFAKLPNKLHKTQKNKGFLPTKNEMVLKGTNKKMLKQNFI